MRYIGSKKQLLGFIEESIKEECGDISDMVFCDLFSGTVSVASHFKDKCAKVYANDWEYYSYVLQRNYLQNVPEDIDESIIKNYNGISKIGLVTENLSPYGKEGRMFFTEQNAKLIDGCRQKIESDFQSGAINEGEYYFLLCSLIESFDKVANTTGVYGAFLKKFKGTASKKFELKAHKPLKGKSGVAHQGDSNEYIKRIKGDILYLDPPYNNRQYGANYHIINYIAEYKDVKFTEKTVDGEKKESKTALYDYNKSEYSIKKKALKALEDLLSNSDFKYIFLSYNDEGIISMDDMKAAMSKFGTYSLKKKEYRRYKSNNHEQTQDSVYELLHILVKEDK